MGHHRMLVLLTTEERYSRWLNAEVVERRPLEEVMRPMRDGTLNCYTAAK